MSIRRYLPSAQFATIVGALAISGGLVLAAQYAKNPYTPAGIAVTTSDVPSQANWQQTLDQIQANSGVSLPDAPDQATVNKLIAGVQGNNLTDSVARSLLVRLADARAQGLGDDIPTQDQIVAEASSALKNQATTTTYTRADLNIVAQSNDTLRAYGNKVMAAFAVHTSATTDAVLLAAGQAVDYNDAKYLATLPAAEADYMALARDLAAVPVPSTLAPLHLELINDLANMGTSIGDIRLLVSDPLRGLEGLQTFESGGNEAMNVLTTLAGSLTKGGILFSKEEPGAAWSAFQPGA